MKKTKKQLFFDEVALHQEMLGRRLTKGEMNQISLSLLQPKSLDEYRQRDANQLTNSFIASKKDKDGAREILIMDSGESLYLETEEDLKKLKGKQSLYEGRINAQKKTLEKIKGRAFEVEHQMRMALKNRKEAVS